MAIHTRFNGQYTAIHYRANYGTHESTVRRRAPDGSTYFNKSVNTGWYLTSWGTDRATGRPEFMADVSQRKDTQNPKLYATRTAVKAYAGNRPVVFTSTGP